MRQARCAQKLWAVRLSHSELARVGGIRLSDAKEITMPESLWKIEFDKLRELWNKLADNFTLEQVLSLMNAGRFEMRQLRQFLQKALIDVRGAEKNYESVVQSDGVLLDAMDVCQSLGLQAEYVTPPPAIPGRYVIYVPCAIVDMEFLRKRNLLSHMTDALHDLSWTTYTAKSGYWEVIPLVPDSGNLNEEQMHAFASNHYPGYVRTPGLVLTVLNLTHRFKYHFNCLPSGKQVRCPEASRGATGFLCVDDYAGAVGTCFGFRGFDDTYVSVARLIKPYQ